MCHELLRDARFFRVLLRFDEDLAGRARAEGCACGGALHSADYPRKPRGGPEDLDPAYGRRLSFCCAEDGCRRRLTPPSVRFLGRRVYLAAVVVLAEACRGSVTVRRRATLREILGVSVRTLDRWRAWWREAFVETPFWRREKGRFMPPVATALLPESLLGRFQGTDDAARVAAFLSFLSPITTRSPG